MHLDKPLPEKKVENPIDINKAALKDMQCRGLKFHEKGYRLLL